MPYRPNRGLIERLAMKLGLVQETSPAASPEASLARDSLNRFPAREKWDDVVEFDPLAWPRKAEARHYRLVPTTCFNCESACGLLAYVDKETQKIRKLEGNPLHPGSRGRNCAKGPATINQVNDSDRILTPMKRVGPRGEGQWREASWDEVLVDIGGRIRHALKDNRRDEVVYHVGRPGAEGYVDRVLRAWGVDGHNSHTNICSSGARFGYAIWSGYDRPAPDYANARFILALNAHFESGHYFNPHAQRISEGLAKGAVLAVVDPRLSNTATMAKYWLPTRPGTEAALMLAFAKIILDEGLYNLAFIERWVNWRDSLTAMAKELVAGAPGSDSVDAFIAALKRQYAQFTPEFAEAECGIPAKTIRTLGRLIGEAGLRFCSHTWRGAASGHLGGWQVARCLHLLHVLTGSVGTLGGTSPNAWSKYKANLINMPPPQDHWNDLHWPCEFPLAHYEMSFLLPHFLKEGRGKIDVYFTRVFNPVWTYPDGFTWIEALRDEKKIALHVALTPTWNETALFADYVLPMGHGPERHDLNTYETHAGTWIAFRQPVLKAFKLADGQTVHDTRDVNPGKVWEEDEFWIALTWAIDPDGSMGIRKYFESAKKPGQPLTVDEYYEYLFDRVPGLPDAAKAVGMTPLEYMRRIGAFEVKKSEYLRHERRLTSAEMEGATTDPATGVITKGGHRIGIMQDGVAVEGFVTESRLQEFFSPTTADWGWPEYAMPGYIRSHVHGEGTGNREQGTDQGENMAAQSRGHATPPSHPTSDIRPPTSLHPGEFVLLPTFRLPTLIHTRSGSAKWLNEISQQNPVWVHTSDAKRLGLRTGDLARVTTRIGYFIDKVWVTESIRPGVVACSHHLGRWRRRKDPPVSRWSGSVVSVVEAAPGKWKLRREQGPGPFESRDADSARIWWREGGVPQNLTHPVHPDPISGMHCWHHRVDVRKAEAGDQCGDVMVDTEKSMAVYKEWMAKTRGPDASKTVRRPLWLNRPLRPTDRAFQI